MSVVGVIETGQENFQIVMAGDIDAENFARDTAVEAFNHAVGLGGIGSGGAAGDFEASAGAFEIIGGKAGSAIRQHMSDPEREGFLCLSEKGDRIGGGLSIVNGEMHEAGAAINGNVEVALAHVPVCSPQLRQVFDVDVDVAEIIIPEAPLSFGRQGWWLCGASVQAFRPQDTIDVVAVEMRQEVTKHESQVIEGKARGASHGADDRTLFLCHAPGQALWPAGPVLAGSLAALAPFANGFVADAVAPGHDPDGLG